MEELLTVKEVAAILKLTPQTIKRMIVNNELKGQLIRSKYRIKKEDLEAFINK